MSCSDKRRVSQQQQQRLSWQVHSSAFRKPELPRFLTVSKLEEIPLPPTQDVSRNHTSSVSTREAALGPLVTKDRVSVYKHISKGGKACSGGRCRSTSPPGETGRKGSAQKAARVPPASPPSSTPIPAAPPDRRSHGCPHFRCSRSCATPEATGHPGTFNRPFGGLRGSITLR